MFTTFGLDAIPAMTYYGLYDRDTIMATFILEAGKVLAVNKLGLDTLAAMH